MNANERPNRGAAAVSSPKSTGAHGTTGAVAERETAQRVHAVAVVADALDRGDWQAEVAVLDALADVVAAASRWAMVAELEEGSW